MASNTWSGYPNGRIPVSKMNQFRNTGKYMQPDAANWLGNLIDAANSAGHSFEVSSGEDLYRDFARQQYFWNNQKSLGIVAAYPGTSNHGWGLAADVNGTQSTASWAWLVKNAPNYHYKLLTVPTEKWHWLYTGPTTTSAGGGATPIIDEEKDDEDMTRLLLDPSQKNADGSAFYWVINNGGTPYPFKGTQAQAGDFVTLLGTTYPNTIAPSIAQRDNFIQNLIRPDDSSSAPTAGATKADLDAAAANIIAKIPTKLSGTLAP